MLKILSPSNEKEIMREIKHSSGDFWDQTEFGAGL